MNDPTPIVNNDEVFYRVSVMSDTIQYKKVELALFEKELKIASEGNPYDYSFMKVIAEITSPSNNKILMPAFWYQDYSINCMPTTSTPGSINGVASTNPEEVQCMETVSPVGNPHYRVRFLPTEAGTYNIQFKIYKYTTLISTEHEMTVEVEASSEEYKGLVQVDTTNNQTFRFSAVDETYVPVGQNTCWYTSNTRKTEDYGVWYKYMADNNMNQTRIWLAPWGFALHGKSYNDFSDRYSSLARLDKTINYLEEYNIYTMLCLINHGQFSTNVNATWDDNPYNVVNGGILSKPYEFFTKDAAKEAYKNELLYIIARYSYSTNIMAWELFNEVDWCDGYSTLSLQFKIWHSDMALFIKENDPYHHMVSTSYKGTDGNANNLECIDFVSPHDYSYSNRNMIAGIVGTQEQLMSKYSKPVFFGEIGLNGENGSQNYDQDSQGIVLHQGAWAGMMSGAGGAMNWWWDSYVHPYGLYYQFYGAGLFAEKMNLMGSFERLQNNASTSNSNIGILGYSFNNRAYGYLYNKIWTFKNTSIISTNNFSVTLPIDAGDYEIVIYNTENLAVVDIIEATSNGELTFTVPTVLYDVAFIVGGK